MVYVLDADGQGRLDRYFDSIGGILERKGRRASFAHYALGLFSDCERKSVEPIAARLSGDPARCRADTDRLLHFIGVSEWPDQAVRKHAAQYALQEMMVHEKVEAWIVDDTGFPKQGKMSPGVQRQYSGTLGKTGNCQVATSVTIATHTLHLPVDMDLYLPESWTEDNARCREARIPENVGYRPKWRIALDLIKRNIDLGIPRGVMLADSAYGDVRAFRDGVSALGFDYAVDIKKHTRVVIVCDDGSGESEPMTVEVAGQVLGNKAYRMVTWRQGTKAALRGRFARARVRVLNEKDVRGEEQWLIIEQPKKSEPLGHYVLSTLPNNISTIDLVHRIKQRWRTERAYQDLKGELGLDHFEGRSYTGWQHHVTCSLACYAFLVAERARVFPPKAKRTEANRSLERAA